MNAAIYVLLHCALLLLLLCAAVPNIATQPAGSAGIKFCEKQNHGPSNHEIKCFELRALPNERTNEWKYIQIKSVVLSAHRFTHNQPWTANIEHEHRACPTLTHIYPISIARKKLLKCCYFFCFFHILFRRLLLLLFHLVVWDLTVNGARTASTKFGKTEMNKGNMHSLAHSNSFRMWKQNESVERDEHGRHSRTTH